MNQRRQPIRNDTISYWDGDCWDQVRIIGKVRGYRHYYHCRRDSGETFGVYCQPATIQQSYFWSLIEPPLQLQIANQEVLRCSSHPPSASVSPISNTVRQEPPHTQTAAHSLNLPLCPHQEIQEGSVHTLPPLSSVNKKYQAAVSK